MIKYVNEIFEASIKAHTKFAATNAQKLIDISQAIAKALSSGGKLLLFGNGGSAADSQHIAAEFVNRFVMERPPLPAIALTTDTSALTAIGNDYDFNDVFDKQVAALATPHDIIWGISTSGNSENVIRGLRRATKVGAKTIGFAGKDGGAMKGVCDYIIIAEDNITARIQEIHIMAAHIICGLVDEIMFGKFSTH